LNVFVGENGHGKTNIIESIYLISKGESFRYLEKGTLLKKGTNQTIVSGMILEKNLEYLVQLVLAPNIRTFEVNQKRTTSRFLRANFPIIVFSPESLSAIKDSSEVRRSLIDDLVVSLSPANAKIIARYKQVLLTRNRILSNYQKKLTSLEQTMDLISAIHPSFIELGAQLTFKRIDAISGFQKDLSESMKYISGKSQISLRMTYLIAEKDASSYTYQMINDALRERCEELCEIELKKGTSLVGPQRHDIKFIYDEFDSRFFCSQGQQRAIILAFKMAQIVYHRKLNGIYPVLILDDVLSELDEEKQKNLVTFVQEINTQIFLTTTDFKVSQNFEMDNVKIFKIRDGKVFE